MAKAGTLDEQQLGYLELLLSDVDDDQEAIVYIHCKNKSVVKMRSKHGIEYEEVLAMLHHLQQRRAIADIIGSEAYSPIFSSFICNIYTA
jgi:hypothetical protein